MQFWREVEFYRLRQILQEPLLGNSTNSHVSENFRVELIDCFTSCDFRNGAVQIVCPRIVKPRVLIGRQYRAQIA